MNIDTGTGKNIKIYRYRQINYVWLVFYTLKHSDKHIGSVFHSNKLSLNKHDSELTVSTFWAEMHGQLYGTQKGGQIYIHVDFYFIKEQYTQTNICVTITF